MKHFIYRDSEPLCSQPKVESDEYMDAPVDVAQAQAIINSPDFCGICHWVYLSIMHEHASLDHLTIPQG